MSNPNLNLQKFLLLSIAILAIFVRFLSISGADFHKYGEVLSAYFQHPFRIAIFVIQFIVLAFVFNEIFIAKLSKQVILVAIGLITIVSVLRYFIPIFLVCVIGDLLIIWWLHSSLKSNL